MEGITLSLQWRDTLIILESECLELVNILKAKGEGQSKLASLVREIKMLPQRKVCITHISPCQNIVSDCIANYARTEQQITVWLLAHVIDPCCVD